MNCLSKRVCVSLFIVLMIGLTGCQDSLVEPRPDPISEEAMSQAEFDKQLAENGVVILQPKDYAAFGISDAPLDASKTTCDNRSDGDISYGVCSNVSVKEIDNVDFFRVTIDASITDLQSETICDGINPCRIVFDEISVTSSTTRGDGVKLQDGESDGNSGNLRDDSASTDFVALYPKADDFTFNHTSDFTPVNDDISVTLNP